MNMKKILALLIALVLVVGLAACETKPATDPVAPAVTDGETPAVDGETPATDGEVPADGVHLNVHFAAEPSTIDPALNTTLDGGNMILHAFEGLMKWGDGGGGTAVLVEGAAESYEKGEVAEDGSVVYTFKLRQDAKWSDGQPVTAEDFVYSWQRILDPETASEYNYMADMLLNAQAIMDGEMEPTELGIKAVDEHTLEITLYYDCPYFIEVAAFPALVPVRKDIVEANGDQWTFEPETYISNGPMKMSAWEHNSTLTMVKNENYRDIDSITIDSITFRLLDDENALLSGFKNGEIDYIREVPIDEREALIASGDFKSVSQLGTYYLAFNNEVAPFDNPLVREAFSLAIDREFIVNNISRAGEKPATGFVPEGMYDKDGPTGDSFRKTGGEFIDASAAGYEANKVRAQELLAEAGYPEGEGFPIVEYKYNTLETHKAIAEALQGMWKDVLNIDVTISNQDWAVFNQTRVQGDYQIARHGWIADYNDPISFMDLFVTGGGNNDPRYSSPAYDEAIAKAKATSDVNVRMEEMHKAEKILMDEAGVAPVYFYTYTYMMNKDLEGTYYTPLGYMFFMNATKA